MDIFIASYRFFHVLAKHADSFYVNSFRFIDNYLILYTRLDSEGNISTILKKYELRLTFTQNEDTRDGS